MRVGRKPPRDFFIGFVSALLLLAGFAFISQAVFLYESGMESYIEFLQTPVFSLLDVFSILLILLLTGLVFLLSGGGLKE